MAPWVKKITEEYEKYLFKRKFSLSVPIVVFFFCFIGSAIDRLAGAFEPPISGSELVEFLPFLLILSFSVAAIVDIKSMKWI